MSPADHFLYGAAWVSFGALHSLLASPGAKAFLRPHFGRAYRLLYNIFAMVHLALVFVVGWWVVDPSGPAFAWPLAADILRYAMRLLGLMVLLVAMRAYDGARFLGFRQLWAPAGAHDFDALDEEALHVDGLHRYVRHPLYSGLLLVLWGNVSDEFTLATAVWGSLYLLVGIHFEERGLIRRFGDAYRDYRAAVPALVPYRGRAWAAEGTRSE